MALPLGAVGDRIEEQLAADSIEGTEAELAEDQHIGAPPPLLEPRRLSRILGHANITTPSSYQR